MPKRPINRNVLRWLTLCLLVVLAILLLVVDLFTSRSSAATVSVAPTPKPISNLCKATAATATLAIKAVIINSTDVTSTPSPTATSSPSPTPTATPSPSPTPSPTIGVIPNRIVLDKLDVNGVVKAKSAVLTALKKRIQKYINASNLTGLATFIIVYVGVSNQSQLSDAQKVGTQIEQILMDLDKDNNGLFARAQYSVFLVSGMVYGNGQPCELGDPSTVEIDIYVANALPRL